MHFRNSPNYDSIGQALLVKCKEGTHITNADIVKARDMIVAAALKAHESFADWARVAEEGARFWIENSDKVGLFVGGACCRLMYASCVCVRLVQFTIG